MSPFRNNSIRATLALGALALAVPAAAQAATVTYRDGNDVWRASVDGAVKQQITNDGTDSSYYTLPSSDDAGDVATIQGSGTSRMIVWIKANGERVQNVMPWKIGGGINAGPTNARVNPEGTQLVYGYLYNSGIPPYGTITPHMAVVPPAAPGSPTSPMVDQPYIGDATWLNGRIVASDYQDIWAEQGPLDFKRWLSTNDSNDALTGAEVARDNSRVLVLHSSGQLELVQLSGGAPPNDSNPTASCTIQPQGSDKNSGKPRISLSADGKLVSWSDDNGVHVARVDTITDGACQIVSDTIISPTGSMPAFSEYSIPKQGGGNDHPNGPTGPTVTAGKVTLKAGKLSAAKLRKGVTIKVSVSGAGKLSGKLLKGKTALASGKSTAKKAGNVKLKLKATAKGRKQLRRLQGKKLALRVTFAPAGGSPVSRSVKVRVAR